MTTLCRDCAALGEAPPAAGRCGECGSPRLIAHPELKDLALAHIDCDAFYASVEKRDHPELLDRPVIVGGGARGVVLACCYVARLSGIRSAMPMFKALKACPDAVVIPPDMTKYRTVGRQVRALMLATTPLVQPLSIDEAFLDLAGTEPGNGGPAAPTLARLARRIEREVGVTVSIGLSYNKFLAKIASDLDKPRGFAVLGRSEALAFLAPKPVSLIWGVGDSLRQKLARDGIGTIAELRQRDERELTRRYGAIGRRLARFARGEDDRTVDPDAPTKSISVETTFAQDLARFEALAEALRPLAESLARRLARSGHAAAGVTVKLKTADFRVLSRSRQLADPTQRADTLYRAALPLLQEAADGTLFRLIGIGADRLAEPTLADPPDLFDQAPGIRSREPGARTQE
ncbi:MAG TPA: DNA polymerase IV [Stellaceae bacterium]|nr:DNA polymerase IV [Stellaceae bacterium]